MENKDNKKIVEQKTIEGRKIDLKLLASFNKEIKRYSSGAHVVLPKKYIGFEASIQIKSPIPFVCANCSGIFTIEKNYSPNPVLCRRCYDSLNFLKENRNNLKCEKCNKSITQNEFWESFGKPLCNSCFLKEEDKSNI